MATNTPIYDFDREDPGADGWTDRLNGNFSDLETLFSTGEVNGQPIQQIGTSANPAGSFTLDNLLLSGTGIVADPADRPLISRQDRTINVPADYATVQEAVDQIPRILRHNWDIVIAPGTYNEDVVLTGVHCIDIPRTTVEGAINGLTVRAENPGTDTVELDSLTIHNTTGAKTPKIWGLTTLTESPYGDESAELYVYYSTAEIVDCNSSNAAENGIIIYNCPQATVKGFNCGGNQRGVLVKQASATLDNSGNRAYSVGGSVTSTAVKTDSGIAIAEDVDVAGSAGKYIVDAGAVLDKDDNTSYGVDSGGPTLGIATDGVTLEYGTTHLVSTDSGVTSLILPTAAERDGVTLKVIDKDGLAGTNPITINPQSGETIQNQSSVSLDTDNEHFEFVSDGVNWYINSNGSI